MIYKLISIFMCLLSSSFFFPPYKCQMATATQSQMATGNFRDQKQHPAAGSTYWSIYIRIFR